MKDGKDNPVILIAEDDPGSAALIEIGLRRSGLANELVHLRDGQEVLDFFFGGGCAPHYRQATAYVMLLDLHVPKVEGTEVLCRIRRDAELKKLPIVVLTTSDDPGKVDLCYRLGCSMYLVKPAEYERFAAIIRGLASLLMMIEIPRLGTVQERSMHGTLTSEVLGEDQR